MRLTPVYYSESVQQQTVWNGSYWSAQRCDCVVFKHSGDHQHILEKVLLPGEDAKSSFRHWEGLIGLGGGGVGGTLKKMARTWHVIHSNWLFYKISQFSEISFLHHTLKSTNLLLICCCKLTLLYWWGGGVTPPSSLPVNMRLWTPLLAWEPRVITSVIENVQDPVLLWYAHTIQTQYNEKYLKALMVSKAKIKKLKEIWPCQKSCDSSYSFLGSASFGSSHYTTAAQKSQILTTRLPCADTENILELALNAIGGSA